MAATARLIFTAVLLLVLSACTSTPSGPANILEHDRRTALAFPAGYEVQASLHLSRDGLNENYLLAMSTANNNFFAAFLSPQGLPVYNVTWRNGHLHSARQTTVGKLLNPITTVHYLALIFMSEAEIETRIQPGWKWRSEIASRQFYQASGDGSITISYRGDGPWPHSATLDDNNSNFHMTVQILEASLVLPQ